jgi:hypothetical protein
VKEAETLILEKERSIGEEKKRAFEAHVEPFINEKKLQLFEAFCQVNSQDKDMLQSIRMQVSALDAIVEDFRHYINTGKMASISLEQKGE